MKVSNEITVFLAVNPNGDEVLLDSFPIRYEGQWTDERIDHFSIEEKNSAIIIPPGTIKKLTGKNISWDNEPILFGSSE